MYVDEIKNFLMEFVPQKKKKKHDGIQNIMIYPLAGPQVRRTKMAHGQRQSINFRACMEMGSHISLKRR